MIQTIKQLLMAPQSETGPCDVIGDIQWCLVTEEKPTRIQAVVVGLPWANSTKKGTVVEVSYNASCVDAAFNYQHITEQLIQEVNYPHEL